MNDLQRSKKFFTLFPVPDYLLLSTSGLAISDDSIKFVQFKNGGVRELTLVHCGEVALAPGIVEAGFVHDVPALAKVLKELKARYGIRYTKTVLPEEKAYLFTTTIDKVPSEGLRDAVAFIVEENVPVKLGESVFDFEVVKEVGDTLKVAVSVLPEKVVQTYIDALEQSEIVPISFDVESQAIARSVVPAGDKRSHMIVNIGMRKTGLYVVEDEVVQFSSISAYGARKEATYTDIQDLKNEVRKLFAFWNTRLDKNGAPDKKIEKVLLCGSGAAKAEFVKELMNGIEVECDLANIWVNAMSLKHKIPDVPFEKSLEYAAAVGLALNNIDKCHV